MNEPAVVFSYLVTYGFIAAYLVRLVLRDRRLGARTGSGSGDSPGSE